MPSSESQPFSASYDSTTKIISTVVCTILVVVAVLTQSVIVAGLGALFIVVCYAYSPTGYAIQERSILVNRLFGNVFIPLDSVREIRKATADDMEGCIRLFASGGLFGYYGVFRTSTLGKSSWYVTNRSNSVVVITTSQTVVLSPNDVEGFIAAIRPELPQNTLPGAALPPLRSPSFASQIPKVIVTVVMIAGLTFGLFCILYSPGAPSYTLTPNSLTIHDRFYPVTVNAASVDIGRIRIVDFGVDKEWQPTERANGFANSHYRSGWFRLANRQRVRLYRADSRRLVLLPPKGDAAPVLFGIKEPEKFVAELRQAWSSRS